VPSVVFYDPYLEVLGGGEKYLLTILESAAHGAANEIELVSSRRPQPERWRRLNVEVEPGRIHWRRGGHLAATLASRGADLLVALTNDFPPLSLARTSVAIVQFPFVSLRSDGWWSSLRRADRRRRLSSYGTVVCYSEFVARAARERLNLAEPVVLAPPVDVPGVAPHNAKETKVLAVGRFFDSSDANNKKHDVLIRGWRRLQEFPETAGWELHLAGGLRDDQAARAYLEGLRRLAGEARVHFHPNASREELLDLYGRCSLFWHAAGFGETRPERYEHFGITTVEAMAFGCVPIVVGLGGQLEIVRDRVDGRLWHDVDGLVEITSELMRDSDQRDRLSTEARMSARRFEKARFVEAVRSTILAPSGIPS
jgi:glycosyltransferase involved in cell wall biosynthesis